VVLSLKPMSPGVSVAVWGDMADVGLYNTCHASTQTDLSVLRSERLDHSCVKCGQAVHWFGPIGLSRSPHFGQFWHSHCDMPPTFLPLGEIPNESQSTKPRNLEQIIAFIENKFNRPVRVDMERLFVRKRSKIYN